MTVKIKVTSYTVLPYSYVVGLYYALQFYGHAYTIDTEYTQLPYKSCINWLNNFYSFISYWIHIMPLVINSLSGEYTHPHTHMHVHIHARTHTNTHRHPQIHTHILWTKSVFTNQAHIWFNNNIPILYSSVNACLRHIYVCTYIAVMYIQHAQVIINWILTSYIFTFTS